MKTQGELHDMEVLRSVEDRLCLRSSGSPEQYRSRLLYSHTGLHFGRTCVALIAICFIPEGPRSMLLAQECLDDTVRNCNHFLVRRRLWRSQAPSERPCRNMCISNSKRDCDLRRPVRSKRWATRLMIPKTQIGVLIGSQRRDYQKTSMAARVDGQR
jgi:hypothetical protein